MQTVSLYTTLKNYFELLNSQQQLWQIIHQTHTLSPYCTYVYRLVFVETVTYSCIQIMRVVCLICMCLRAKLKGCIYKIILYSIYIEVDL